MDAVIGARMHAEVPPALSVARNGAGVLRRRPPRSVVAPPDDRIDRRALTTALDRALAERSRPGTLGLLCVGFEELRLVTRSLGHEVGDQLLDAVTMRLTSGSPGVGPAARVDCDSVVVVLESSSPTAVVSTARDLLGRLRTPVTVGEHRIAVSWSAGLAYATTASTSSSLLREASGAMDDARSRGPRSLAVFSSRMDDEAQRRLRLQADLVGLAGRADLGVVFQPIVRADRLDEIVGFEALARWEHPELGSVPPSEFIPLAEETGQIGELGERVLRQAATAARAWSAGTAAKVSVNVSTAQLRDPDFARTVRRVLDETGLPPSSLVLELTEQLLAAEDPTVVAQLDAVRAHGIALAVDDFGTGYSSLAYLDRFPIDVLKLDRRFTAGLSAPPALRGRRRPLALAMIDLAASLDLTTVAEGVETVDQLDQLRGSGCELVQGFLVSPPVSAQEAVRLARRDGIAIGATTQADLAGDAPLIDLTTKGPR
jgi:diguanylate cyclase (GGDEF)-like protein